MSYGFCIKVWGDYACFTRPEMKVERVSYDVITPSSARGILEAIYWKPEIRWIIDKIHVLNPIVFCNIRRNEIEDKMKVDKVLGLISGKQSAYFINSTESRQQRASLVLKNVSYCIEAHFELTANPNVEDEKKHYNIALRRFREGKNHHRPVLGTREFSAHYELLDEPPKSILSGKRDLGYMLYDMKYSPKRSNVSYNTADPIFFRAVMNDGIIDVHKCMEGAIET